MTNDRTESAKRGEAIINQYAREAVHQQRVDDEFDPIVALLTDIRHYVRRQGEDYSIFDQEAEALFGQDVLTQCPNCGERAPEIGTCPSCGNFAPPSYMP